MCPPDFYGIDYEINPWMDRKRPADHVVAVRQWQDLHRMLQEAGATVSLLPSVAGLPDLVFTANAALVYQDAAVLSHFRPPQRQPEEPCYEKWFSEHGFRVRRLNGEGEKGTGPICRNGPKGASHKLDLSPFPASMITHRTR
jgi:N-dimethylarginine dimethylaminohydrolase